MPQSLFFMKWIADISTGEGTPEKRANGEKEHNGGNTQHRKLNGPNSLRAYEAEGREAQSGST